LRHQPLVALGRQLQAGLGRAAVFEDELAQAAADAADAARSERRRAHC
jgi:hypothetical protein